MSNAKQMLEKVLQETGLTLNSLAKVIGLKRSQNLYDIDSGKVKNISAELSEKICNTFPKINRKYLLTGEGDFLNAELVVDAGTLIINDIKELMATQRVILSVLSQIQSPLLKKISSDELLSIYEKMVIDQKNLIDNERRQK